MMTHNKPHAHNGFVLISVLLVILFVLTVFTTTFNMTQFELLKARGTVVDVQLASVARAAIFETARKQASIGDAANLTKFPDATSDFGYYSTWKTFSGPDEDGVAMVTVTAVYEGSRTISYSAEAMLYQITKNVLTLEKTWKIYEYRHIANP